MKNVAKDIAFMLIQNDITIVGPEWDTPKLLSEPRYVQRTIIFDDAEYQAAVQALVKNIMDSFEGKIRCFAAPPLPASSKIAAVYQDENNVIVRLIHETIAADHPHTRCDVLFVGST